jgi:hypothetical protein
MYGLLKNTRVGENSSRWLKSVRVGSRTRARERARARTHTHTHTNTHTHWEGLVSRVRKTRYLIKKNETKTPLGNEWEIYDSFVTLRESTKTGQMLLYTRTRYERRGNIKRNGIWLRKRPAAFWILVYVYWKGARINNLDFDITKVGAGS